MENPFTKRATELLRDDEAFLAVVSPGPITHYLQNPGEDGSLYDRLIQIRGTPGSGKTTLARLFEFGSLMALLRNTTHTGHTELVSALRDCHAMTEVQPLVLGVRIPLESDYRDFWEFDYEPELKISLMTALLQARAVLGWMRALESQDVKPDEVKFILNNDYKSLGSTIGGTTGTTVRERAAEIESAVYSVATSLVPPSRQDLPAVAISPYRPFTVIERIHVPGHALGLDNPIELIPLVIFDDAHVLHPEQLVALERVLIRREMRIARWIIARFDILKPADALSSLTQDMSANPEYPGITADRDQKKIILQNSVGRLAERKRFRNVAKDIASRYLRRMHLFNERRLTVLGDMLRNKVEQPPQKVIEKLDSELAKVSEKLKVGSDKLQSFRTGIDGFLGTGKKGSEELRLSMLIVMTYRYSGRRGQVTGQLFPDETTDNDPPVAANASVRDAAEFQLFHQYGRPYYYSVDDVCDASTENAEQFLQLTSVLIESIITRLIRGRPATLTANEQHQLLREKGSSAVAAWNFPAVSSVKNLVDFIASKALELSLRPNGAVIANAFGIAQEDFDNIPESHPQFARTLQFAVAYNAVTLVPNHSCKKKSWCLIELGGLALLKHGLTLKRGGFVEGTVRELIKASERAVQ